MRRTFRRHIRKTLAPDVPPVLQEANFVFDKGQYGRAGELFERMAETAAARGEPRAPLFYLQAGRARILAGQTALGMPSLQRGLELLAQREQLARLHRAGRRVIADLNEQGLHQESAEISAWLESVLPSEPAAASTPVERSLPGYCPSCGAKVRPDEVEWQDDNTAECAYCGNPLRTR